jgi:hypothetical protein
MTDNFLLDNSNSKTYWKIMKMLIKSNKGNNSIPPIQNTLNDKHFDDIVYDDPDKCELLNKYFTLISKLNEENKDLPEFENRTDNIISDIQIRENEIEDILHTLDPQKASGPDHISYKMLKISPDKNSKTT